MRAGRKFKSIILLCVTILPVLYVFYGKDENTGTQSTLKVSGDNEWAKSQRVEGKGIKLHKITLKDQTSDVNRYHDNPATFPAHFDDSITRNVTVSSEDPREPITGSRYGPISSEGRFANVSNIHVSRILNLRASCDRQKTDDCEDVRKCNLTEFYYSRQYNFAYCKVPKSGSTFWMKLFLVLYKGEKYLRQLNAWSRSEIHTRSKRLVISPLKIYRQRTPTVIVARNPYSRLFSAYTDKVFMPLFWHLFKDMKGVKLLESFWVNRTFDAYKKSNSPLPARLQPYKELLAKKGMLKKILVSKKVSPVCANNVSFEDFLKFIIAEVKADRVLEPHWAPISRLCRPCMFNTQTIIKQEQFAEDVAHALKYFNVNASGFEVVKKELSDRRVENSIPGIVGVVEVKAAMPDVKKCIATKDVVKRLWKAFQIQGYISDKEDVPEEVLTKQFNKFKIISKAMSSIKSDPMSPEKRSYQRRAYLIKAYKSISPDIIRDIQTIFRSDFELFDYPIDPPVS